MKNGINLGLRIKWSTFLTAPITCALLAGLLMTTSDQALASTNLQFDRDQIKAGSFSSIFRDLRENGGPNRTEWQSGTFLKNFLEKQKFNDHSDNGQAWWNNEKGFMNNQHHNAIEFGNHLEGLLRQENDNHYKKHHDSVVPIPASVWLFGSALGLLGWFRRSKA